MNWQCKIASSWPVVHAKSPMCAIFELDVRRASRACDFFSSSCPVCAVGGSYFKHRAFPLNWAWTGTEIPHNQNSISTELSLPPRKFSPTLELFPAGIIILSPITLNFPKDRRWIAQRSINQIQFISTLVLLQDQELAESALLRLQERWLIEFDRENEGKDRESGDKGKPSEAAFWKIINWRM